MSTNNPSVALVQTLDRNINQLQQNIVPRLNRIQAAPVLNANYLQEVDLVVGSNTINHLLGRPLAGWVIIRKRAAAEIYDTQDSNTEKNTTLHLTSNAVVTVDLMVF